MLPLPPALPTCQQRICVAASVTSHRRVKGRDSGVASGAGEGGEGRVGVAVAARQQQQSDRGVHRAVTARHIFRCTANMCTPTEDYGPERDRKWDGCNIAKFRTRVNPLTPNGRF